MQTFRIAHPFHPLRGQSFEVVTRRQNWASDRVFFYLEAERLVSVPLEWTDLAPIDPFVAVSAGRAAFRPADLMGLVSLVRQMSAERARRGT